MRSNTGYQGMNMTLPAGTWDNTKTTQLTAKSFRKAVKIMNASALDTDRIRSQMKREAAAYKVIRMAELACPHLVAGLYESLHVNGSLIISRSVHEELKSHGIIRDEPCQQQQKP